MAFDFSGPPVTEDENAVELGQVLVIGAFGEFIFSACSYISKIITDRRVLTIRDTGHGSLPVTLARQGFMPTTPIAPGSAIEVRTLELYRAVNSRCPGLGIQPFVRSVCDLQQVCIV